MRISFKWKDRKRGQRSYPKSPILVTTVPRGLYHTETCTMPGIPGNDENKGRQEKILISQKKRRTRKVAGTLYRGGLGER